MRTSALQANEPGGTEAQGTDKFPNQNSVTQTQALVNIGTSASQDSQHGEVGTAEGFEARPSPAELGQQSNDTSNGGKHGKDARDYEGIVRELQRLKRERKTQEQAIEEGRKAMPDTSLLQKRADEATARELELIHLTEEARQKAEAERRKSKDALAQKARMTALEKQLEQLRLSSHNLRLKLDIDD